MKNLFWLKMNILCNVKTMYVDSSETKWLVVGWNYDNTEA